MTTRQLATLGILTALIAALGYALASVPNVELVALSSFVSGFVLGSRGGAFAGAAGMALYSVFNPLGLAPPAILTAQVAGAALYGAAGGWLGPRVLSWLERPGFVVGTVAAGAIGAVLTAVYDLLTNVGVVVDIRAFADPWPIILGGMAFSVAHVGSNAAVFAGLLPAVLRAIDRRRGERLA